MQEREFNMSDKQLLSRITTDQKRMLGKPVIRGTRLTVDFILGVLAHGSTFEELLQEYEGLTREDLQACLLFASQTLRETSFLPLDVKAS